MITEYNKFDDLTINFHETNNLFKKFYKDDLNFIYLKFIYINRLNEIEKIKKENFFMSIPSYITREEILEIIKKSHIDNDKRYSLLSILRYNITLDNNNINNFLNSSEERNFLITIKNIDAISFEKTINMFKKMNDLIFIFYEKSTELKNPNPLNTTKKILLHSNTNKKTIKKRYKD